VFWTNTGYFAAWPAPEQVRFLFPVCGSKRSSITKNRIAPADLHLAVTKPNGLRLQLHQQSLPLWPTNLWITDETRHQRACASRQILTRDVGGSLHRSPWWLGSLRDGGQNLCSRPSQSTVLL
jgi:hypothetical protein